MPSIDEILDKYTGPTSAPSYGTSDSEDPFIRSILDKYTQKVQQSDEGYLSKGLHAVGSVLGAPKAGIDYLARAGARAQGLNVPDTATTGEMMRNALGFNQGYETSGYGGKIGGGLTQLATDVATDPVTWAMGGLGGAARGGRVAESVLSKVGADAAPEITSALQGAVKSGNLARPIQRGAEAAFLGTLVPGTISGGRQFAETYGKEGFSPKAAEEAVTTAATGLGALGVGTHFFGKTGLPEIEAVKRNVQVEPNPANLASRLTYYEKRGQTDFADIVRQEIERRKAPEAPASPVAAPEPTGRPEVAEPTVEAPGEPTKPLDAWDSFIQRAAKDTGNHPVVDAATPEEAKAVINETAKPAEEAAAKVPFAQVPVETRQASRSRIQELVDGGMRLEQAKQVAAEEAPSGPIPAVTEPVSPERGISPVESPLDADTRRDDGAVAAAQGATPEPPGVPTPTPDVVRQPEEALPVPPVGPNDTIPFPSKPPNPQRVALEVEVLRQRPNLDRDMVKRVFDEVEEGKRPVESTVNALLKMDQRYGPAPFRGWEGHLFNDKEQPSSLPPEKQAALKGVVENAPPEATGWIAEANAAAKAAEEARTGRQESYDEGKAKTQAERDAAAEELQPQYSVEKPRETLKDLRDKYTARGVDNFVGEHGDTLTLSKVVVPKGERGQGIGSEFMRDLTAYADANGKRLVLSPSTDFGGTSRGRLTEFYKRFGFTENKGRNKDFRVSESMIREPLSKASVAEPVTPKPLTVEDVKANFKGYLVEPTETGFKVTLPGGRKVTVEQTGHIDLNPEALEKGHGKAAVEGVQGGTQQIVGSYRRIGPESVIQVADQGTLPHEVWHGFMDHVASPKEKRIAERDFAEQAKREGRATEEVAADSYRDYFNRRRAAEAEGKAVQPKGFIDRVWSKVYEFFRNAYRSILPNMEYIQEQLYKGKPWEKATETAGATEPQYSTTPPPVTAAPIEEAPKKPTLGEKIVEIHQGTLLGPGSNIANVTGNVAEAGARLGEKKLAAGVDWLLTRMHGGERTRFSDEAAYELKGQLGKFNEASEQLGKDLKDAATLAPEKPGDRPDRTWAVTGKPGAAVHMFGRMMGAFDDFFGKTGGAGELGARALRKARMEMPNAPRQQVHARADQIIADPELHKDLLPDVEKATRSRLFKPEDAKNPDKLLKFANDLAKESKVLGFLMPFRTTPYQIAKLTVERSPYGFVKGARAYRAWKAAVAKGAEPEVQARLKGEAADALARPVLGTAILATFATFAKGGGMTGSGPVDKRQQALQKASGWQPYSFVVKGADGKNTYIPFNRFEPISSILGFAADIAEMKDQRKSGDLFEKVAGSIANNLTSKTYLASLSDAFQAYSNPKQFLGQYLSNTAGSLVPNVVSRAAQAIDPIARSQAPTDVGLKGVGQRILNPIMADLPGLSQMLPAQTSGTGEEVTRPGNPISRLLSPIQITSDKPQADLERAMIQAGYAPGNPSRDFTIPGTGGKKIRLQDNEYKILQQANKEAADYLRSNLGGIQRMKLGEQEDAIKKVFERARTSARNRLMASPSFRARAKQEVASVGQS